MNTHDGIASNLLKVHKSQRTRSNIITTITRMSSTEPHPGSETRSITEVIIRAVATHIFAGISIGNLGSLLKLPKNLHAGYVAVFLLYPMVIIGQLVYGAWATLIYEFSHYKTHGTEDLVADLCFDI